MKRVSMRMMVINLFGWIKRILKPPICERKEQSVNVIQSDILINDTQIEKEASIKELSTEIEAICTTEERHQAKSKAQR